MRGVSLGDLEPGLLQLIYQDHCASCILRDKAVCRRFAEALPSLARVRVASTAELGRHAGCWGQPVMLSVAAVEEAVLCRGEPFTVSHDLRRVVGLDLRACRDVGRRKWVQDEDKGSAPAPDGFKGAMLAMVKACPSLQKLVLPPGGVCKRTAHDLSSVLRLGGGLRSLDLGGSRLEADGARLLAEGLRGVSTLSCLSLAFCAIGQEGVEALSPVFANSEGLAVLGLDCNKLCEGGARALAASLRGRTRLKALDLGCNYFGKAGVEALTGVLQANTGLEVLRLGCNDFGWGGVQVLTAALAGAGGLRVMDLSKNDLGGQGAQALVPLLQTKERLSELLLGSNGISARHVATVRFALPLACTVSVA